jgi:hypothetical protein
LGITKDLQKELRQNRKNRPKSNGSGKKHENNFINRIENEEFTNSQPAFYHFRR